MRTMNSIIASLTTSKNILIISHMSPDGDAIGSAIGMGLAMQAFGKHVTLYNESEIPAVYRFLPAVDKIVHALPDNAGFDTAIVLDCGNLRRIGDLADKVRQIATVINIDHHATNTHFGSHKLIDHSACATSEIVFRLIQRMGITIDKDMATALYTGILTDTGSFRFSNTNSATFSICNQLVALGASPYDVAHNVYGNYSLGRIRLLNMALTSLEFFKNSQLAIMTLTQSMLAQTKTLPEDAEGFISYAKRIENVKVAAFIQDFDNSNREIDTHSSIHVSLRSDGSIDVAQFAASFGGGGHPKAAGFNSELTVDEIRSEILQIVQKF